MIYLKKYDKPAYDKKEILRYMGCRKADGEIDALIDDCIKELADRLVFKVCCSVFPIKLENDFVDLTFMQAKSRALMKNLQDCDEIILFAATTGLETDRLIARYSNVSPLRSVAFQAIGAERAESLCDKFEAEKREEFGKFGKFLRPRFSPGYGDFALSAQKAIFDVLDCERKIGLTLNDSLLMSPSKSVTALIGVSDKPDELCACGCETCGNAGCAYRKQTN